MSKKFISAVTAICLILSCLTVVPAMAVPSEASVLEYDMPEGVVLDAQFGEGDNGGFELLNAMTGAALTTEPISAGSDNYVLKFTATNHSAGVIDAQGGAEHIAVKLNGDNGIEFVEGRNITVETKFKKTNDAVRAYLKYNINPKNNYKEETANLFSLVSLWHDGTVRYANGSSGTGTNLDQVSMKVSTLTGFDTSWLTLKIVIKGDSLLADMYFYDEAGNLLETVLNSNIKQPVDRTSLEPTDPLYIKEATHLKTLAFRARSGGTTSATDIVIDYIKVTQQLSYTSELDKNIVGEDENIVVSMVTDADEFEDVSAFYDLYDANGQLVESEKSFDKATKKLTINPLPNLIPGENYNIRVDKDGLLSALNYIYNSQITELPLSVVSCKAENVSIEGRLVVGQFVEGSYSYTSLFDKAGETFAWYTAPSPEGPWSVIENETSSSIEVTMVMANNMYLKMSVKPESTVGEGVESFSNILAPESAPIANNLSVADAYSYIGDTISATYDYFDANGDAEDGTVIKWYIGDTADSNAYEMISISEKLELISEYAGKYIKFSVIPKNNAAVKNIGEEVFSDATGPVSDYLTGSNLFLNPGFETGTTDGIKYSTFPAESFVIIPKSGDSDGRVYSGDYSLYVAARPENYSTWGQEATYVPGKTYLLSGMVKSASFSSVDSYEGYGESTAITRPFRDEEKVTINNEEWTRVTLTVVTNETQNKGTFGLLTFTDQGKQDIYVDDMYFGELKITDIVTEDVPDTVIPESENLVIKILKDKMLNQFGTTTGLKKEIPDVEVVSGIGVEIDNNNHVIITPEAVAGEVVLKVSCTPETTTAPYFAKTVSFTLLPNTDVTPSVKNVVVSGNVAAGETLSVNYDYRQVENQTDVSTFKWFYQDTFDGNKTYIPGATGRTYVVSSAYANKFIGCEVTPVALGGSTGSSVCSNIIVRPVAPFATELEVTGKFNVGEVITAKHKFNDYNLDQQAGAEYSWYISDSVDGTYTPISGETKQTLKLTADMIEKYLKFAVIPKSDCSPYLGEKTFSQAFLGPVKPIASNLSVSNNGMMFVGSYDYYHHHNMPEKNTKYEWYVDGSLVSTKAEYVVNFEGRKTITFKVIPCCEGNPTTGDAVSVSFAVSGNVPQGGGTASGGGFGGGSSSGGGSGSGGSAGSTNGFTSGVQSINDSQEIAKPDTKPSDIDNHWGKSYIAEMESRGIMAPDNEGKYNPDEFVARGDMIEYLFKALKLTESEYTGEFTDVKADDKFSGMLQTMVNNGTISKYDTFRPKDGISREELCKVLYISLENAGKLMKTEENKILAFTDYSAISNWAIDYVNAIYQNGIMIGVSDNEFAPKENVTKAQVATLLTRILDIIER